MALGFREGAEPEAFRTSYGFDIEKTCAAEVNRFLEHQLMERTPAGRWRLTRAGLPVADTILSELI